MILAEPGTSMIAAHGRAALAVHLTSARRPANGVILLGDDGEISVVRVIKDVR